MQETDWEEHVTQILVPLSSYDSRHTKQMRCYEEKAIMVLNIVVEDGTLNVTNSSAESIMHYK